MKNPFTDDYGTTGLGVALVIFGVIAVVALISWGVWYAFLRGSGTCEYPNHLVYAGWKTELVGKVVTRVDQYYCEPN